MMLAARVGFFCGCELDAQTLVERIRKADAKAAAAVEAALSRIASRVEEIGRERDSCELGLVMRFHAGRYSSGRFNPDERLPA